MDFFFVPHIKAFSFARPTFSTPPTTGKFSRHRCFVSPAETWARLLSLRKQFKGLQTSMHLQLRLALDILNWGTSQGLKTRMRAFRKSTKILQRLYSHLATQTPCYLEERAAGTAPLLLLCHHGSTFKGDPHKSVPLMAPRWPTQLSSVTRALAAGGTDGPASA